jgi:hypothetical protein
MNRPKMVEMIAFDLLQVGGFKAQVGKVAVRLKKRDRPSTRDHRNLCVGVVGDVRANRLIVGRTKLETLPLAARIPNEARQEGSGVIVAQVAAV